jgi:hypothetical protein
MSKRSSKSGAVAKPASASNRDTDEPSAARFSAAATTRTARRFARNDDELPPPSLDDPWGNLHPARIWPD